MMEQNKEVIILLAEDDEDDALLTKKALKEYHSAIKLIHVKDGEELMEYLLRQGVYEDPAASPRPDLILLDLNMPKKDGREALKEIKESKELHKIPVTVLTTSSAEEDVVKTYDLGVNSFIVKPITLGKFSDVVKVIGDYWVKTARLPTER